jgi:protein phosphatase
LSTAVLRYSAAALTDRGRKRTSNEDAFGYSPEHGAYVVCDGMGGAAAGEIASSLAVDEFLRLVSERRDPPAQSSSDWTTAASQPGILATVSAEALIAEAVDAANEAIHSRAKRNLRLSGMGTTLVGLLIEEHRVLVLNVGDSRCYCLRAGRLRQITEDHSLVEQQVRLGRMTPAEAARSPFKNVITRAVGTQPDLRADIFSVEPEPGDLFLLCSDGLTRELPDARIEALLTATAPLDEICKRLIQAANKAGGHDNITCLLVRAE